MLARLIPAILAAALVVGCSDKDSSNASGSGTAGAGTGMGGAGSARPGSQEDLAANVGDRVFFDTDRSTLQGTSQLSQGNTAVLDRQAAWLKQYPQNMIQIAGNCDERAAQLTLLGCAGGCSRPRTTWSPAAWRRAASPAAISRQGAAVDAGLHPPWAQNRNAITSVR